MEPLVEQNKSADTAIQGMLDRCLIGCQIYLLSLHINVPEKLTEHATAAMTSNELDDYLNTVSDSKDSLMMYLVRITENEKLVGKELLRATKDSSYHLYGVPLFCGKWEHSLEGIFVPQCRMLTGTEIRINCQ